MTVGDLLRRADARELSEWKAFFLIEKKQKERADLERRALENTQIAKQKLQRFRER